MIPRTLLKLSLNVILVILSFNNAVCAQPIKFSLYKIRSKTVWTLKPSDGTLPIDVNVGNLVVDSKLLAITKFYLNSVDRTRWAEEIRMQLLEYGVARLWRSSLASNLELKYETLARENHKGRFRIGYPKTTYQNIKVLSKYKKDLSINLVYNVNTSRIPDHQFKVVTTSDSKNYKGITDTSGRSTPKADTSGKDTSKVIKTLKDKVIGFFENWYSYYKKRTDDVDRKVIEYISSGVFLIVGSIITFVVKRRKKPIIVPLIFVGKDNVGKSSLCDAVKFSNKMFSGNSMVSHSATTYDEIIPDAMLTDHKSSFKEKGRKFIPRIIDIPGDSEINDKEKKKLYSLKNSIIICVCAIPSRDFSRNGIEISYQFNRIKKELSLIQTKRFRSKPKAIVLYINKMDILSSDYPKDSILINSIDRDFRSQREACQQKAAAIGCEFIYIRGSVEKNWRSTRLFRELVNELTSKGKL